MSWWTPNNQLYAYNYLTSNGVSDLGAQALISRWANVESPNGPSSINPSSGAFGIGQWLGSRLPGIQGQTGFDAQLAYVVHELNGSESRAANLLNNATTPYQAAQGATAFERAEGWNASTNTDNFTSTTANGIPGVQANVGGAQIGGTDIFGIAAASPSQLEDAYGLPPGTLTDNPQMLQDYQQDYAQDIGVNQTFQDTSGNFANVPIPPSRPLDIGQPLSPPGSDTGFPLPLGQTPSPPGYDAGSEYPSGVPGGMSFEQMQQLPSGNGGMPGPVGAMGIGGGGPGGGGGLGGLLGGLGGIAGGMGGGMPSFAAGGANQQAMGIGGGQDMGSTGGAGGIPVNITDAEKVAKKAGEDTKKGAEELGQKVQSTGQALDATMNQDTKQLTQEATKLGDFTSKLSTNPDSGLLPRIGVGAVAIVMIGVGLWMLGKKEMSHGVAR